MRAFSLALASALALSHSAPAQQTCDGGATCTLNLSATASINSVAQLSISTTTTTLTTPATSDFGTAAGVNSTGPTITVKANVGYTLTASAASTTWTGGSNSKPASDLKMSVNGGAFTALGQIAQTATRTTNSGNPYTIAYNTIYNWTVDKPGNYSLVVKYTLTAP